MNDANKETNAAYEEPKKKVYVKLLVFLVLITAIVVVMLDKYGHDVTIWSWKEEEARRIREDGEHKEFLPGVLLRKEIKIVTSPSF